MVQYIIYNHGATAKADGTQNKQKSLTQIFLLKVPNIEDHNLVLLALF